VADFVLSVIRMICNWYAARRDDYQSPIVKGMRRTDPKAQARARILEDDEIRAVWKATETDGVFGCLRPSRPANRTTAREGLRDALG
jgi:hypothetical protein